MSKRSLNNIRFAFFLNFFFTFLEFVGGYLTNSLAIASDALHDLGDSFALGMAWYLEKTAQKPSSKQFSYGYKRFSLLGALINCLILIGGSVFISWQAIVRLLHPEPSNASGMLVFAILGIVVNAWGAWKLHDHHTHNESIVHWHLIEDLLGWCAVLIASAIMHFYPSNYIDPVLSLGITLFILFGALKKLSKTFRLFLQGTPGNIDLNGFISACLNHANIIALHDYHLWSLDGNEMILTTHIVVKDGLSQGELVNIKTHVKNAAQVLGISHCTLEIELESETCEIKDGTMKCGIPSR